MSGPQPAGIERLIREALETAHKAKKHRQSLSGSGFYAYKLMGLRAKATVAFRALRTSSAGDVSALAEMVDAVFGAETSRTRRRLMAKDLVFALRTTWPQPPQAESPHSESYLFPPELLDQTKRGYLVSIGRQMNGCYAERYYDACAVMMRRLLEVVIIEAFETAGKAADIQGQDGNYVDLSALVGAAIAEPTWHLSRTTRAALPGLRTLGHQAAHGRYYSTKENDILRFSTDIRIVVEEFLYHAKLL